MTRHSVFLALALSAAGSFAGAPKALSLPASATNPRNGEGDFLRLADGRILFVYTEYVGESNDDHARAHLVKRISADGGESWSAPVETAPRLGARNDMSASLLRMKDGRIGLFFLRKNSVEDCRPVVRYSADEGETWSAPVECLSSATNGYFVLNNARAERLSSGRIVLPLSRHAKDGVGLAYGRLSCVYSDDDGRTWRQGRECLPTDTDGKSVLAQEPGVVELKDGRLYLYARTDRGRQWQAFSKDGGETFADFGPSPICGPRGPATIKRLVDGRLLLVWNDHEGHPEYGKMGEKWLVGIRAPLTIAFSSDEGRTWTDRRTVDAEIEKGFFCYFATIVEGNDLLLHTYSEPCLKGSCVYRVPLASEEACGGVPLFNGRDLTGWEGATHMYVVDPAEPGVLRCDQTKIDEWKTCNLWTKREYADFVLTFECSMAKGANNGVGIRMPEKVKTEPAMEAFCEVQLIDDDSAKKLKPHQHTGSVYGVLPAKAGLDGRYAKPCGEWSKYEIRVVGPNIRVTVDGRVVAEGDLSTFRGDGDTPDGWKHPGLARRRGRIALLGHYTDGPAEGMVVRWRNMRILEL